jgi:hypothetical protein
MAEYHVRIRKGEVEIEVGSSDKGYVDSKVTEWSQRLSLGAGSDANSQGEEGARRAPGAKGKSVAEHVRALAPKSGPQYVIAVGDYLERFAQMTDGFKTRDLVDGFRTVKYRHSNPAEAVRQAKQQGFLMDGKESGTLLLTQTAEAWVKGQLATEDGDEHAR